MASKKKAADQKKTEQPISEATAVTTATTETAAEVVLEQGDPAPKEVKTTAKKATKSTSSQPKNEDTERISKLEQQLAYLIEMQNKSRIGDEKVELTTTKKEDMLTIPVTYWINQCNHVMSSYKEDGVEYVSPTMRLDDKTQIYKFGRPIIFKQVNTTVKRFDRGMRESEIIHLSKYETQDPRVVAFIENSPSFKSGRIFKRVMDPKNVDLYRKRFVEMATKMISQCSQSDIIFKVLNEKDAMGNQLVKRSDDYEKMRNDLIELYANRFEDDDRRALDARMKLSSALNMNEKERAIYHGLTGL